VSHTTRPPRTGEIDGLDYHFVDQGTFLKMRDAGEFAEWAVVHENLYGTSKAEIESRAEKYDYVIFEIDCQGAASLRKHFPQAVSCFILPPSMSVLKQRLSDRGTEDAHSLGVRLENARAEIRRANEFDFCLVNENINETTVEMANILKTSMLRSGNFTNKINELLKEEV